MALRVLVIAFGIGVVVAATHANIMHAGGYLSDTAPLALAVSGLLAVGMGYVGMVWNDGSKLGAVMLGLCLLAGEAYWLGTNAEREIAARDELAAPIRLAETKRLQAEAKVTETSAAMKSAGPAERERLKAALEAKRTADLAAVSEAAKPGCRANCATLLMDAKDRAETEVNAARRALAEAAAKAESDWRTALGVLEALPAQRAAAPLPEKLGIASWAWDLIMAALRSGAVMGGSIAIGLCLHGSRRPTDIGASSSGAQRREVIVPPLTSTSPPRSRDIVVSRVDTREHVSHFLRAALRPDPNAAASLRELHGRYVAWCETCSLAPLPPAELGRQLRAIVDTIGLEVEHQGRDAVVRGAALVA